MAYLLLPKVQHWLAKAKYDLAEVNPETELATKDVAFAFAGQRYATTTWVDAATTPSLILSIMSMLYAAWELMAATSEDDNSQVGQSYPARLERRAYILLDQIRNNVIDLEGVVEDPTLMINDTILFFPTSDEDLDVDHMRKFEMGAVF